MFIFYNDPAHAWLRVKGRDLAKVGLGPSDFSIYSYRKENMFYLEEDCDAPLFIKAWVAKNNKPFRYKESHTNSQSHIRNFQPIMGE